MPGMQDPMPQPIPLVMSPEPLVCPIYLVLDVLGPDGFTAPMSPRNACLSELATALIPNLRRVLWTPKEFSLILGDHLFHWGNSTEVLMTERWLWACHRMYAKHRPLPEAVILDCAFMLEPEWTSLQGRCKAVLPLGLVCEQPVKNEFAVRPSVDSEGYENGIKVAGEDFVSDVSDTLRTAVHNCFMSYDVKPEVIGLGNSDWLQSLIAKHSPEPEDDHPF